MREPSPFLLGLNVPVKDIFMKRRSILAAVGLTTFLNSLPLAYAAPQTIVVGVTAGPHAEIMEFVKPFALKTGLGLRIVEFFDFVQPNAALVAGDLDINSFQHQPYMDQQNADRGYRLVSATPTPVVPFTCSKKRPHPSRPTS